MMLPFSLQTAHIQKTDLPRLREIPVQHLYSGVIIDTKMDHKSNLSIEIPVF